MRAISLIIFAYFLSNSINATDNATEIYSFKVPMSFPINVPDALSKELGISKISVVPDVQDLASKNFVWVQFQDEKEINKLLSHLSGIRKKLMNEGYEEFKKAYLYDMGTQQFAKLIKDVHSVIKNAIIADKVRLIRTVDQASTYTENNKATLLGSHGQYSVIVTGTKDDLENYYVFIVPKI